MDATSKVLIDECLTPELVLIARQEFRLAATYVPWLGTPPRGTASWQDPDIVERIRTEDWMFVTNNRRDFVNKYYERADVELHSGLIVILEKIDRRTEHRLFRAVMDHIAGMSDTVNKLVEIDGLGNIRVAEWPDTNNVANPWADPFKW